MDKKEQVSMKLVFEEIERIENVIFGRQELKNMGEWNSWKR